MKVIARGMAYGAGSGTAALTIPRGNGMVVARQLYYDCPATGTLVFYRPRYETTAHAAVSATTTLVIHTDASGHIGGAVLTTSDYVLVSSTTSDGYQLSSISSVAAVSSSTVSLGLGSSITCAILNPIYIIRAADICTVVTGDETTRVEMAFNGIDMMPVHVLQTATGNNKISVAYDIEGA
jgi:hypothetical protein